jgi:hypothetical protein
VKAEFEKNNFMCLVPVTFFRSVDGEWVETSKQDMDLVTMELEADGKPFFPQWLKDKNKRKYKKVIWYPKDEREIDGKFNTFEPFEYEYCPQENEGEDDPEGAIEGFKYLLSLLTNHIPSQTEFLHKFIAHLIQKPWENPEVCLCFKGLEGGGKDTLLVILELLMGKDNGYVHVEQELNNILGNFNGIRSKKLVLGLNEMEGQNGVKFREAIKHMITAKKFQVNEKYGKQRMEECFTRFVIFANGLTPIQVGKNAARRFAVFDTSSDKIGVQHKPFWKKFYQCFQDPYTLQRIFNNLCEVDIEDWNPSEHVETESKTKMAILNNNPVYSYLQEVLGDVKSHDCYEYEILKGEKLLFAHWGDMSDDYEMSDHWEREIKMREFKKLILTLNGVTVKRRGKKDQFAMDVAKVKRELELRLVQIE